ncbi:MAG TPA: SDR family NAD(P)-dependent oxidoreductase [Thermoanaerobaculia bacterium]|nr:SDR family NAD(P)-dependent oxidoreductase [Thermoanaerobaculia bacterium]
MKTIAITGATGDLGRVVVPRLSRDYKCVALSRALDNVPDEPLFALVSLAGAFAPGHSPADFAKMIDANLTSFVRAYDAVLPRLEPAARIIAISSAASLTHPAGLGAYSASKAALNSFVQTLGANALLPDTIDTDARRTTVAEWIVWLLQAEAVRGQLITLKM